MIIEMENRFKQNIFYALLIVFSVFLGYFNTLDGEFIHDDRAEIEGNIFIRSPVYMKDIFLRPSWAFNYSEDAQEISNYYRPLQYLTYMFVYMISGAKPAGYHLLKIFLHCIAAIILFFLTRRITGSLSSSILTSIIFSLHPINTEAVTWISGITDVLAAVFVLSALYCFIIAREGGKGYMVYIFFFMALLSKETALVLLPMVILYDYLFIEKNVFRKKLYRYALFLIPVLVYLILRTKAIGSLMMSQYRYKELSLLQCLYNQFYLYAAYSLKVIVPMKQNAWYIFKPVLNISDPRYLGSMIMMSSFAILMYRAAKYGQKRRLFYAAWFFISLLPVVVFFRHIGWNVFTERYMYLPSIGFSFLISDILHNSVKNRGMRTAIMMLMLTAYLFLTVRRNAVWHDPLVFWEATSRLSGESDIVCNNLGNAYYEKGRYNEALKCYDRSIRIKPDSPSTYYNIANYHYMIGDYDSASELYKKAMQLRPSYGYAYHKLADVYFRIGMLKEAEEGYKKALEILPYQLETYNNLGLLYYEMGSYESSVKMFRRILSMDPGYSMAYFSLGRIYYHSGRKEEASKALLKALEQDNGLSGAYLLLARIYNETGDSVSAIEMYKKYIELVTDDADVYDEIGHVYMHKQMYAEAVRVFSKAVSLDPDSGIYNNNLAVASYYHKDPESAVFYMEKAMRNGFNVNKDFVNMVMGAVKEK